MLKAYCCIAMQPQQIVCLLPLAHFLMIEICSHTKLVVCHLPHYTVELASCQ